MSRLFLYEFKKDLRSCQYGAIQNPSLLIISVCCFLMLVAVLAWFALDRVKEQIQTEMESFSFEVAVAASGKEGITELENADMDKPFELVIMDWKMPYMDGIEASKRIKDHTSLNKIPPIVMVTAYGREEVMQQADQVDLEGFLLKPVNSSLLFDTIMEAFGKTVSASPRVAPRKEQRTDSFEHIHGARILLVEDNEINQQVAKEILESAGLVVTIANNGQDALEFVTGNVYDAVLMDVQMPVMDGYTATRKIREVGSRRRDRGKQRTDKNREDQELQAWRTSNIQHSYHRHDRSRHGR